MLVFATTETRCRLLCMPMKILLGKVTQLKVFIAGHDSRQGHTFRVNQPIYCPMLEFVIIRRVTPRTNQFDFLFWIRYWWNRAFLALFHHLGNCCCRNCGLHLRRLLFLDLRSQVRGTFLLLSQIALLPSFSMYPDNITVRLRLLRRFVIQLTLVLPDLNTLTERSPILVVVLPFLLFYGLFHLGTEQIDIFKSATALIQIRSCEAIIYETKARFILCIF